MNFLKRSASFTRFRAVGQFSFAHDKYQEALQQNVFRDLSGLVEQDQSIGWVSPENCLQPPQLEMMLIEPYIQLMMRVDKRKVPAAIFAAHFAIEEKAALESSGKKRLSLNERRELRLSVKKFLLEKATPSTALYRALWNFRSATCFLFATSKGVQNHFGKLFSQTFGLQLEPLTPWMIACEWAERNQAVKALQSIEMSCLTKE